jgi:hypothetical protein
MAGLDEVCPLADARLNKCFFNIATHFLPAAGRRCVKWYVSAFGRNDDLIPGGFTLRENLLERFANAPFASLTTIIRGRVENIAPQLNRAFDGMSIRVVGTVIGIAQIRSKAD